MSRDIYSQLLSQIGSRSSCGVNQSQMSAVYNKSVISAGDLIDMLINDEQESMNMQINQTNEELKQRIAELKG